MGYYADIFVNLIIKKENVGEIVNQLLNMTEYSISIDSDNNDCVLTKLKLLLTQVNLSITDINIDEADVDSIILSGKFDTKIVGQEDVLDEIAPLLEDNSFVTGLGEDGVIWKWKIKNGELHYLTVIEDDLK